MEARIEYVPISELRRWPRNPKEHDVGEIARSIRRFGLVSPLILDEGTGRIVAGHGRLEAIEWMADHGQPAPLGVRIVTGGEWRVPVLRGIAFRGDGEAEAYLLADNRIGELGGWNEGKLAEILEGMARSGGVSSPQGTGFDYDDLNAILDRLSKPPEPSAHLEPQAHGGALLRGSLPGSDVPDVGRGKPARLVECPSCGFEFHVR